MWCAACGSQLVPGARFCTRCGAAATTDQPPAAPSAPPSAGTPAPGAPTPPAGPPPDEWPGRPPAAARSGRLGPALIGAAASLVALLVVAVLLVVVGVVSVGSRDDRIEGPGYATPEQAAEAYLTAMRASDVPAMIRTFAVETYAEHADGALMVERNYAWMFQADPELPRAALNDDLNAQVHLSSMSWAIYYQYLALSDPDFAGDALTVGSGDDDEALAELDELNQQLAATFDGTAFAGISSATLMDWQSALPQLADTFNGEQNQQNIDAQARPSGADEVAFQVADLQTRHGEYLLFLQLNRYGDRWWVGSFSGNLAALVGVETIAGGLVPAADVD